MWQWLVKTLAEPVLNWIGNAISNAYKAWQRSRIKKAQKKEQSRLNELGRQLEIAKENNNEKLAAELRAQLLGIKKKEK